MMVMSIYGTLFMWRMQIQEEQVGNIDLANSLKKAAEFLIKKHK